MCGNSRAISLSIYTVHHLKAKYIDIKHNFIRDHIENGYFVLNFINSENQLANIFTKAFLEKRFYFL